MSGGPTATANPAQTALPCAACKQPVVEIRSAGGALVVLDAATKRLHLCVKRKEVEAAKAKQLASRPKPVRPGKPIPPVKRPEPSTPAKIHRPPRPSRPVQPTQGRADRPTPPVRAKAGKAERKAAPRAKAVPATLRSREQVEAILTGRILRWRTPDGPTSFCAECSAPVLVGFSHVRWDVLMLDAAGHRPHDCEFSRAAAAALHSQPPARRIEVPDPSLVAERASRPPRPAPPIVPSPPVKVGARPRRRVGGVSPRTDSNSCDTCGNLKALVAGEWVCRHCGA